MSARAALVRLELRQALPAAVAALGAIALVPVAPWLLAPEFATREYPTLLLLLGLPLAAAALGGMAIASERARGTWRFLLARPVSKDGIAAVKLAVRAALVALVFAASLAILSAWSGGTAWLEMADVPLGLGLRLSVALAIACFLVAFLAGAKMDDPVMATLGGGLVGTMLVLVALLPGLALGGSAREALTLSPGSWLSARRILSGAGEIWSPAMVSPSGAAVAFDVSDGKETSRVAIVYVERQRDVTAVSDPVLLARGTEIVGWHDATRVRVRWPGGVERLVALDGRTSPLEPVTEAARETTLAARDGELHLGATRVYPRIARRSAP